jgi:hypothetical protein
MPLNRVPSAHATRVAGSARTLAEGLSYPTSSCPGARESRSGSSGEGIEIGALRNPLPMPPFARVRCLDRLAVFELRATTLSLSGNRWFRSYTLPLA